LAKVSVSACATVKNFHSPADQVGKLQLFEFLYNARLKFGDKFDLLHWHDYVWLNGNIPIALMQKEYLAGL
jgi:uncharacterized protein (DUF885 family)